LTAHERTDETGLIWRKASRSTAGNDCVEIAQTAVGHLIRDSKDQAGPHLRLGNGTWTAFIDNIKRGRFEF
jgi:Domain of unknown function (DUF397)